MTITFAEHQKNENHFYGIGIEAFEIFRKAGALNLIQRKEDQYALDSIEGNDDNTSVTFTYKCWLQGDVDVENITLSCQLVDNFDAGSCLAAAVKRREANEAEAAAKKAVQAEAKANDERRQLVTTLFAQAERLGGTTALELAAPFKDEKLNAMINERLGKYI